MKLSHTSSSEISAEQSISERLLSYAGISTRQSTSCSDLFHMQAAKQLEELHRQSRLDLETDDISISCIEEAWYLLQGMISHYILPEIMALADGGIGLQWFGPEKSSLFITLFGNQYLSYSFISHHQKDKGTFKLDDSALPSSIKGILDENYPLTEGHQKHSEKH